MSPSRRDFLKQVSAAAAFGVVCPLPRELWALTPGEVIPEVDEALLRELAFSAVEVARAAGAEFADVRVTGMRRFRWDAAFNRAIGSGPSMGTPNLVFTTGYGVRALLDGAWGFAGGSTLTPEGVTEVARRALGRARANRPRHVRKLELAPVARVENGVWAPPIEQDPFDVPVGEQADLWLAALAAAETVPGVVEARAGAGWTEKVNVFASSEGALLVQRVMRGGADGIASGRSRDDHDLNTEPTSLQGGWYGYETVSRMDVVAELRETAERAVANSRPAIETSRVPVEVGRYDLVLSGWAVSHVMQGTLAAALNLERALGYRANREGTSYAAPPADILNKYQVGSRLVTLRADRTRPHARASVGWDDEGVPAGEWNLIEDGVIVDYLTSRQTAMELASSYQARGEAVRSRGCMVGSGEKQPGIGFPNLTLLPGDEDVSADDLIADTKRGIYISGGASGGSDQQLLSGQYTGRGVHEIRNGKLGHPLEDFAFQFMTSQFWKNLDALGGPKTMVEAGVGSVQGLLGQHDYSYSTRAPAARVRQVNVLNTGATR